MTRDVIVDENFARYTLCAMVANRIDDSEKLSLVSQLVGLATNLRQERLYVTCEQNRLQQLNKQVTKSWYELTKFVWRTWQQRICVNKLSISHCDSSPSSCCNIINTLDTTEFEEAHKILSYQANRHCTQLLNYLKNRPELLAQCLSVINQTQSEFLAEVLESIILGLYGCCLLPEDRSAVLQLLLHLTNLQLATSEDPLRLIRHGSCAFARLYSLYHEGLYSGTLFLTAALHSPIMNLLMEDEHFLDIDPEKAVIRFTPCESLKTFGPENGAEYKTRLQKYRQWTIEKLVSITNKFIENIHTHIHCFPNSICYLVRHIYHLLASARELPEKEIFALCVDLVITSFICPAIVDPESHGIVDAPISYIARFNLIQVAKILQMLAMRKYEPVDPKVADLYIHFDENCLTSIINVLLENVAGNSDFNKEINVVDNDDQLKQMAHNVTAYFTEQQLHNLIIFLQSALSNDSIPKQEKAELETLLSMVATDLSPSGSVTNGSNIIITNDGGSSSPITAVKRPINLITKAVSRTKVSATAVATSVLTSGSNDDDRKSWDMDFPNFTNFPNNRDLETVLVFTLDDDADTSMLGLLTEQQVLRGEKCTIIENSVCDTLISVSNCVNPSQSQIKTSSTCCSSQDGEEVVSEAGSNQSEDSSIDIEAEDQNDNLSDMISANVSGRGTPNISGRDTPSSQIIENDNEEVGAMEPVIPPPPPSQIKQPRFDLDDKFGKFEIKNLPRSGDETVSMVSDTWSTDVLASDSENIDHNQSANSANISSVLSSSGALAMFQNANFPQLIDISETASEGWSTDVVVSDSDRVTEVDTDDTASVARSDITTRSEVESRGEEGDANMEDISTPSMTQQQHLLQPSHNLFQKKESGGLIHVIDPAGGDMTIDGDTRPNLMSTLSQSSTSSQSRSCSSHQASMDSEDIRVTSGDLANASMSSAASVSSSCSSAGIGDGDHVSNKQFILNELSIATTSHLTSIITNSVVSSVSCSSTVTYSNGYAIIPTSGGGEKSSTSTSTPRTSTSMKSVFFDKTAEKGDKEEEHGKIRGMLRKFRIPALSKGRSRDSSTPWGDSTSDSWAVQYNNQVKMAQEASTSRSKLNRSDSGSKPKPSSSNVNKDSVEAQNILDKYRKLTHTESSSSAMTVPSSSAIDTNVTDSAAQFGHNEVNDQLNIHCEKFMFENAKKKLRYVLSNTEIQRLPCTNNTLQGFKDMWSQQQNVLVAFLQLQLAEAIHLKDRSLTAHLHETVRCVKAFDDQKCLLLLENLRKEYKARTPYLSYLMQSRQTLLSITAHLNRLNKRLKCEQDVCKNFFASLCTRLFLQKKEQQLLQFAGEFHSAKVSDEKNDVLRNFLTRLEKQIDADLTWQGMSDEQLEAIKIAIEKSVISRVYMYAMFPNGDADVNRDEVLFEHIKKLGKIITPNHRYLGIPKKYHYECPWPAAQQELISMSAYKTPAEKLGCILRCTQTIQNLLCLACHNSIPSADILVPVLVYVIIRANPPSLLSTIQYVNSFYGTRLQGEEQYWWVQFCSAVEFIKTMEYGS